MRGDGECVVLDLGGLEEILGALRGRGHEVIGPRVRDGAIVLGPVGSVADLPAGQVDEQGPGHYRLRGSERPALFDHTLPAQGWKRYLFPPAERVASVRCTEDGFAVDAQVLDPVSYALVGVRACDLAALAVHDRVFTDHAHADPAYGTRRDAAFVVAVDCARAAATCFCVSMDTGPRVRSGYDLVLTELLDERGHRFLAEAGSDRGAEVLAGLGAPAAPVRDRSAGEALARATAASMVREMPAQAHAVLAGAREHPRWEHVAARCLACGNCTMACPTCFCVSIEDTTDLDGSHAERWRHWDSCFTGAFSHVHGGSVRRSTASRYRQWLTHKLSSWHEQFGSSGCVGCGRCITWCPVGIDLTEEVRAMAGGG